MARRYLASGSSTLSKAPRLTPEEPSTIVRGQGCRVWDYQGREFIDYRYGLGPVTLGYCHPKVDAAIADQLTRGIVFGQPTPLEEETAELFCSLVPAAEQVRFLKTGGEANAAVIRIARAVTGRDHVVQIGYQGWLNSLAHGARVLPGANADSLPGVPSALAALHHQVGWEDRDTLAAVLAEHEVALVIVSADYAGLPEALDFYRHLREVTTAHGALLAYDEIVTGFRVATGGVQEWTGVLPDLCVFAKGVANGMPLSVFGGRADLMAGVDDGSIVISSTFGGEALSLAAARAVMTMYRDEAVCDQLWAKGTRLWDGVSDRIAAHGAPITVRGLPVCPQLGVAPGAPADTWERFLRGMYARGVSLYNVSYINLSHDDAAIDATIAAADEVLATLG